ncbi:MAG: MlaE family lipid ABC transporter permease subunit [Rickettsiales bacterium]
MPSSFFTLEQQGSQAILHLQGAWNLAHLATLEKDAEEVGKNRFSQMEIDGSGLEQLDTSGAWMLRKLLSRMMASGADITTSNLQPRHQEILTLTDLDTTPPDPHHHLRNPLKSLIERLGHRTVGVMGGAYLLISFLGEAMVTIMRSIFTSASARWNSIIRHIDETGVDAIPIVSLIAFLIAVVLAYQGANQLRQFGADIFTVDLTAISILREMGVLLTAIMVAGRSGSAFTAEIGVMKVNEEIDAMRVMGLDAFELLVVPRLIALVITLPILTFIADIMGLFGVGVVTNNLLGIPIEQYLSRIQTAVNIKHFWVGFVKAPVFAFLIGIVGCLCGMKVGSSAESVGKLTTISVVASIFLVLLADALFSILFSNLKI